MKKKIVLILFCICVLNIPLSIAQTIEQQEAEARQVLNNLEPQLHSRRNTVTEASWAYASNITDANLQKQNEASADFAVFLKDVALQLKAFDFKNFRNETLKRQLQKLTKLGYAYLPDAKYKELLDSISAMESNYAKIRICSFKEPTKCDFQLEPELTEILAKSRDEAELRYYWLEWYNKAGAPVRAPFQKYIDLNKEAAVLNGFNNGAEMWLDEYEVADFEQQVDRVVDQLMPLYRRIHAYVRYRLRQFYGNSVVSDNGPIPMHLLGNMWAQTWDDIIDITAPFPGKTILDVTQEMLRQGYTPNRMFQLGEEFFTSLDLPSLTNDFWQKSILEKPNDGRDLVCHASAWDFYKKGDVRIKQCTRVNMDQLFVVHHELGHIQYYLLYQDQPYIFKEGANPGFHEAVGDLMSLSVSSPKHLQKIGLLNNYVKDDETVVNQFFKAGLGKFVFLPFAYTLDKYRWGIFRGEIQPSQYNCKFWELRHQFSGIEPPALRTESDFDAPAKYHISADVEYLRYFVSYIVQFQFHKAVCEKAGEYVPGDPNKTLIDCDIYNSKAAGAALRDMLSLGSSKPWPDAMEVLTGTREMDASALLEYFKPLNDFLEKEIREKGIPVGWGPSSKYTCSRDGQ